MRHSHPSKNIAYQLKTGDSPTITKVLLSCLLDTDIQETNNTAVYELSRTLFWVTVWEIVQCTLSACFYADSSTLILRVVLTTLKTKITLHTQRLRCWSPLPSVVRKLWTLHAPPKRYKLQTQAADLEKQQFCPWFSDTRLHRRTWSWAPSIFAVAANRNSLSWITRRSHVPNTWKLDRKVLGKGELIAIISGSSHRLRAPWSYKL